LIADRHQRVVQAELGDAGIVEADVKAENRAEPVDRLVEITGGDDNLA
jgi:hypothetical protein